MAAGTLELSGAGLRKELVPSVALGIWDTGHRTEI